MKTDYIKSLWLVAFPLALMNVACQNEEMIEADHIVNTEGQTILRANMSMYDSPASSRAQVEIGYSDENQELFMWNNEDCFTLYNADTPNVSSLFTIAGYEEDNPSASASFVGESKFVDGTSVTAIYPAQDESVVNDGVTTLTLPTVTMTDGLNDNWKNYMCQSMFMYANTAMTGDNTNLTFNHLCAMIRISYVNATDSEQEISNVTLTGEDKYFGSSIKFNVQSLDKTLSESSKDLSLNFENFTVDSWGKIDLYFLFFPGEDASDGNLSISINGQNLNMSLSDMMTGTFEAGKRYWFNVIQTGNGLAWKKDVAEGAISNLPLIQMIENQSDVSFDKDENGFVDIETNKDKIAQIDAIEIRDNLDNLDGLEYFTNLKKLVVSNLGLKHLDVSLFKELECLLCSDNALTQIDLSQNVNLKVLECSNNKIKNIDLGANLKLEEFTCQYNLLEELDVAHLSELKILDLQGNKILEALDVSNNLNLEELNVGYCYLLKSLEVSHLSNLRSLEYSGTDLIVDFSQNVKLEQLGCADPKNIKIDELDVSMLPNLKRLDCAYSGITSLDLSQNPDLEYLRFLSNDIMALDLSSNLKLKDLECGGSKLCSVDISQNNALETLWVIVSPITSLDLTGKVNLETLQCYGCQITSLDITGNPNIGYIACGDQYDAEGNEIEMTLYLTEEQLPVWNDMHDWNNERVKLDVQEPSSN